MMAHLQQPPPRVTDFMPTLPAGLDWVIATAMAKDPAHRYGSAGELAAAAAAALRDASGTAAPTRPVPISAVTASPAGPESLVADATAATPQAAVDYRVGRFHGQSSRQRARIKA